MQKRIYMSIVYNDDVSGRILTTTRMRRHRVSLIARHTAATKYVIILLHTEILSAQLIHGHVTTVKF
jgi:hypothetical protein